MVAEPVEGGIRIEEVCFLLGVPAFQVRLDEFQIRITFPGLFQHLCRGIDSHDSGIRPSVRQQFGGIAGPTAQVINQSGRFQIDPAQQVHCRTEPVVSKLKVLFRIPADFCCGHGWRKARLNGFEELRVLKKGEE